ncbi:MAG TPA: Clp protease N-terminal domain-containing protein [Candidatus Dormibacteraeota bacterium]|nr:Clp protease N-terminal domain-containing protein [Candidatus Dormibacteraeota bacterium]
MAKATTVRFTDEMFGRLDQASARTGMPVNSIVIAACLEWMQRHTPATPVPEPGATIEAGWEARGAVAPRWATLRRAVKVAVGSRATPHMYPFERFTASAQKHLTLSQTEALKMGFSYIGTEHMLLASFGDPDFKSAKVLATLGVEEGGVRSVLNKLLDRQKRGVPKKIIPTSRVKVVIESAFKLCDAASEARVSTGHLLLALATEGEGIAAHVLKDLGATSERIRESLTQLTEPEA